VLLLVGVVDGVREPVGVPVGVLVRLGVEVRDLVDVAVLVAVPDAVSVLVCETTTASWASARRTSAALMVTTLSARENAARTRTPVER
jgi:hypothetical protein